MAFDTAAGRRSSRDRMFPAADRFRRLIDISAAAAGLILTAPVLLLVGALIVFESGTPIIFAQTRLGLRGRPFRIYKFRKFGRREGNGGCGVTVRNDSRMTRLGCILERTKLDEIPQLWNILRGDMSIVGPRPESQKFADCYSGAFAGVLAHKPGLFGPCQFYFRDEGSLYPDDVPPEQFYREVLFPLKARIDLAYFPDRSPATDVGWIIRCLLAVFGARAPRSSRFDAVLQGWLDQGETNPALSRVEKGLPGDH